MSMGGGIWRRRIFQRHGRGCGSPRRARQGRRYGLLRRPRGGGRIGRAGFTLVELLVVMAAIATLVGILVPTLYQARQATRFVICRSQLRQWGAGLLGYLNENDGWIPRRGQGIRPTTRIDRDADWFNCLPPYLGERAYKDRVAAGQRPRPHDGSIFVCPEARRDEGVYFFPYAMNMYLSPWIRPMPHNIAEIRRPETLVFMADAPGPYSATVPSREDYSVAARHNGRANLVFLDGHTEYHDGEFLGCGRGDPRHRDVRWQTGTSGINQSPIK
ncbi:MAG: prepilin-type N-terminal cleavage/methylation domain-containing protein [Planctomycetes bacterium]|nr:prepilin-type N-terminal cleavage/methylation domain-containing protein [Planctomycetota bacterium]